MKCDCSNNSSCEQISGRCVCVRGWEGLRCDSPCKTGFYGHGCKEECPKTEFGNKTCDHVTGEYKCRPGYIGPTCEHPCPIKTYGQDCLEKCSCKNGAECHHVTGKCQCLPGWTGKTCANACPDGFYGLNCSQRCKCQNGGKCRSVDGACRCAPGWVGSQCTEICPEGYYGEYCMEACQCRENFVCHPVEGCVCKHGYTGKDCDVQLVSQRVQERVTDNASNGNVVLVAGLFLAVTLVAVIILLSLHYRKRVATLKDVLAHVHYVADPVIVSDRHHFDNPVYSYNGSSANPRTIPSDGKLNNSQIKNNNLIAQRTMVKENNLDKQKFANRTIAAPNRGEDDDVESVTYTGGACSSTGSSTCPTLRSKNLEADLVNPNLYHSIEDLKLDHVYEQIKSKAMEADQYDHLNYTRPTGSRRPHYQRMTSATNENENNSETDNETTTENDKK